MRRLARLAGAAVTRPGVVSMVTLLMLLVFVPYQLIENGRNSSSDKRQEVQQADLVKLNTKLVKANDKLVTSNGVLSERVVGLQQENHRILVKVEQIVSRISACDDPDSKCSKAQADLLATVFGTINEQAIYRAVCSQTLGTVTVPSLRQCVTELTEQYNDSEGSLP